jgi:hypothetical protein
MVQLRFEKRPGLAAGMFNAIIRIMKIRSLIISTFIAFGLVRAQSGPVNLGSAGSPTPTPAPTPACTASEFRQFDFWLGRWRVTNSAGKEVGGSEVTRASEGCAIREQWKSASGITGMSINYYDPLGREWHQDWVGGDGTILHLRGGMKDGTMSLVGPGSSSGQTVMNRITWAALPEGKVKQEWSISSDTGRTWQTSFVGIYTKQN